MHILLQVVMATLFVWHSDVLMPSEHVLSARLLQLRKSQHWWASMRNSGSVYQCSLRHGCTQKCWGISMQGSQWWIWPAQKGSIPCSVVAGWENRKIVFSHIPSPVPLPHRLVHWLAHNQKDVHNMLMFGVHKTLNVTEQEVSLIFAIQWRFGGWRTEEKDWKLPSKVFPATLLVLHWDISPASLRKRWTMLLLVWCWLNAGTHEKTLHPFSSAIVEHSLWGKEKLKGLMSWGKDWEEML